MCPERYLGSAGKAKLLLTNGTWIVEECEVAGDEWQKQVGVILDPEISPLFSDDRIAQFKQVVIERVPVLARIFLLLIIRLILK